MGIDLFRAIRLASEVVSLLIAVKYLMSKNDNQNYQSRRFNGNSPRRHSFSSDDFGNPTEDRHKRKSDIRSRSTFKKKFKWSRDPS